MSDRSECRDRFEAFLARDFSDALFFRSHRLFVDAYSLQHPDRYCASAKSLAAHLVGLCWILEGAAGAALGPDRLHRWLDGDRRLQKPPLPRDKGAVTLGDLPEKGDANEWARAVRHWGETIWAAYAPLHGLAREWMAAAACG